MARVGELACQRQPFLRELAATVVSCEALTQSGGKSSKAKTAVSAGASTSAAAYEVVMSDSVLFPEGGGQPCDLGTLHCDDGRVVDVVQVQRRGDVCVLSTTQALPVGARVMQRIDWPRRLDHMQHHTAQHLLTAVLEREDTMALPTVSWSLTQPFCFVQLDVSPYVGGGSGSGGSEDKTAVQRYTRHLTADKKLDEDMVRIVTDACNAAIRDALPVTCTVYDSRAAYEALRSGQQQQQHDGEGKAKADHDDDNKDAHADSDNKVTHTAASTARSRGIPHDVQGPIRVIAIDDGRVDSCTCCGTHLRSLAELQVLHVLHQEVKGNTVKVYFVTGERALSYFAAMYARERLLVSDLGGGCRPEDVTTASQRRGKELAELTKKARRWSLELAEHTAAQLVAQLQQQQQQQDCNNNDDNDNNIVVQTLRRDDVDSDFFVAVRRALDAAGCAYVVLVAAWAVGCPGAVIASHSVVPTRDVQGQLMITGARGDDVTRVAACVQAVLADVKGSVTKGCFRGKGSLREWRQLVQQLQDKYGHTGVREVSAAHSDPCAHTQTTKDSDDKQ